VTFVGSIDDRLRIRERLGSDSDAVFRRDVEDYLACWCEGAVRSGSRGECHGKQALREHWTTIWDSLERMGFFLDILRLKNGDVRRLVGMYNDELVRENGDWLFARRNYEVLIEEA
jgi:ketosteroid isomerase-like protein